MLRIRRKATPLTFIDFKCVPQDTPEEEATDSDEEELLAALLNDNSIEDCSDDIDADIGSHKSDIPQSFKPDRYFIILVESVVAEENSPEFNYTCASGSTVEKFPGKTPMQAAKVAFNFITKDLNCKSIYVFSIEECSDCDKICKTYSYRGVREAQSDVISIKAYKFESHSGGISVKKPKKPKFNADEHVFASDGFFVEKKIIPPLKLKRSKK